MAGTRPHLLAVSYIRTHLEMSTEGKFVDFTKILTATAAEAFACCLRLARLPSPANLGFVEKADCWVAGRKELGCFA